MPPRPNRAEVIAQTEPTRFLIPIAEELYPEVTGYRALTETIARTAEAVTPQPDQPTVSETFDSRKVRIIDLIGPHRNPDYDSYVTGQFIRGFSWEQPGEGMRRDLIELYLYFRLTADLRDTGQGGPHLLQPLLPTLKILHEYGTPRLLHLITISDLIRLGNEFGNEGEIFTSRMAAKLSNSSPTFLRSSLNVQNVQSVIGTLPVSVIPMAYISAIRAAASFERVILANQR